MLVASQISRRFGRIIALDGVDFEARPGEIHALIGENGAGKTTLMNVLAGRLRPDAGTASLDGTSLRAGSAASALAAGIAAVNQSPMLFERFSWEENLALGGFDMRGADLDEIARHCQKLAAQLGFALPASGARIEGCTVGDRVRLEVLRALSFNPRVLILDEPTGVLGPAELGPFLDLLRRLRGEGRIIILVTHKLGEALAVADRITVLRRGRVVAGTMPSATSENELAGLMIGAIVDRPDASEAPLRVGAPALSLDSVSLVRAGRTVVDAVTLELRSGEIVGVAGVDGNGQSELIEILAAVCPASSGRVTVAGDAREAVGVIPEHRDRDGLVLDMPLWENLLLAVPLRRRFAPRGWMMRKGAMALCEELIARFRIRAPGATSLAASLSGGNRQRLAVARAIAASPRVIVAHNPCRGLDLAATADVHRTLLDFAARGGAVLMLSSDLDQLLEVCGRLFVISGGRLRETQAHERNPERLGMLMAGRWG